MATPSIGPRALWNRATLDLRTDEVLASTGANWPIGTRCIGSRTPTRSSAFASGASS